MSTYVYLVVIDPHDYERFPYTFGVYSTKKKLRMQLDKLQSKRANLLLH